MQTTKTDNIFNQLSGHIAKGILEGSMPWQVGGIPPLVVKDDHLLSGINYLLLSQASYADPRWCLAAEASTRGWEVSSGEQERFALFSLPMKDTEGEMRRLAGARMYNYSQLNGPDPFVMPVRSPSETAKVLMVIALNSGAAIESSDVSNGYNENSNTVFVTLPTEDINGVIDLDSWNASMLGVLASYSQKNSTGTDDMFVTRVAHTMLCAEYGVPMDSVKMTPIMEDLWIERMQEDSTYAFKASHAASRVCEFVNQLSPAPVASEHLIGVSAPEDLNNRLFDDDITDSTLSAVSPSPARYSVEAIVSSLNDMGLNGFSDALAERISGKQYRSPKI